MSNQKQFEARAKRLYPSTTKVVKSKSGSAWVWRLLSCDDKLIAKGRALSIRELNSAIASARSEYDQKQSKLRLEYIERLKMEESDETSGKPNQRILYGSALKARKRKNV